MDDEYLDDSSYALRLRAMALRTVLLAMRTLSVVIEMELEREGLIRPLPLEPIFIARSPSCPV